MSRVNRLADFADQPKTVVDPQAEGFAMAVEPIAFHVFHHQIRLALEAYSAIQ